MKYKLDFEVNQDEYSKVIYGDSVTGDTPLLLMNGVGDVHVSSIENLCTLWVEYKGFKLFDFVSRRKQKQQGFTSYKIWTDKGWTNIKRVIRHKTDKKIYEIMTRGGIVKVTEDHSLLDENCKVIKPNKCDYTTRLLSSFPENFKREINITNKEAFHLGIEFRAGEKISPYILNGDDSIIKNFLKGYGDSDGSTTIHGVKKGTASCIIYYLLKKLGYSVVIDQCIDIDEVSFTHSTMSRDDTNRIKRITVHPIEEKFVYDIETEVGRFAAGTGDIIVKNTDSCFIELKTPSFKKFKEAIREYEDTTFLSDKEQKELDDMKTKVIEESFEIGAKLAKEITNSLFKKPIDLEFEKVYHPFIILSKKRYIGNYYGTSPHKIDFVEKKGVVLKRRDNPDIVKKVYTGVIDPILMHGTRGVKISVDFLKEQLNKLMNNDTALEDLVVTKTLAKGYGKLCKNCKIKVDCTDSKCKNGILLGDSDYKNMNLPHVALAMKMRTRDEGSAPMTNDRISYVFVELPDNPKAKLYERAEDLETVKKEGMKIDFLYYVENQLKNPIKEVLSLMMKDADSFFDEVTKDCISERKKKLAEFKIKSKIPKGQTSILRWIGN